jgi:hypothetical protein
MIRVNLGFSDFTVSNCIILKAHTVTGRCAHPQSIGEHGFHRLWQELSCLGYLLPIVQMSLQYSAPLTVIRQVVFRQRALAL